MAQKGMKGVDLAISILLIIVVAAAVLPGAFDSFYNASTSEWPTMVAEIWDLVPLFAILALAIYMYRKVDST